MDIQTEKLELLKMLMDENDPGVLKEVRAVLQHDEQDFWNDIPQHIKDAINEGIGDIDNGRHFSHEEVMKDIKSKYGSQH